MTAVLMPPRKIVNERDHERGGCGVLERRILLLAPTGNDARLTAGFLEEAGFIVEVCQNMADLCGRLAKGCGAVVLAEETLGPQSVSILMETLEQQPSWSDVPVTIITGGSEVVQQRLRKLATSGLTSNVGLLERPFHPETLLSTVEVAWRARQRQYQVRDLLRTQRASELRMQGILESISDAFVTLDREWRFTYVNQSYMKLVGSLYSSPADLLGESLWNKFPDLRGSEAGRFYERTMAEQRPGVLELFYEPIGRWLEVHAYPTPEMLSLYIRDVTGRKQHEEELRDLNHKVEAQANIFDTTLSHIADFAYIFDREGRFLYANKPLLDLWGLTIDEAAGKNFHELNYPAELAEKLQRQIQQVIETKQVVTDETPYTNPDGAEGYYEYIFSPVLGKDGKVEVVAGSTRVITERKRTEQALRESKEAAESANRAKDRFLAVLSHELRTPLTPVMMSVAALEMDPELPHDIRSEMTMIRRNVELETQLIDDLLDLNRIISNKLALRLEPVNLNDMVREAASICRSQILEKSIQIEYDLDAHVGKVSADSARFQQVLWNVLKNAVKFTPERGSIRVRTRRGAEGRAEVEVRDSGIGIAPELLPRIFDAFEQGDPSITRAFGGLGLGLAISRALVELHGGSITALSEGKGAGAAFVVSMPVAAGKPEREVAGPAPVQEPQARQLRLLVVEDHADTARTLGLLLRRAGFVVTTAGDVASALRLAGEQSFDLLISDVGLPDGTGFDLMKQVSKRHEFPGIAMSGYGLEEDISRSLGAGFSEHLVKPVRVAQLEQAIGRVMARQG